jgi:hypothetical protein
MATLFDVPKYQGIANTIVQLIPESAWGVISASQPIRPEERQQNIGLESFACRRS